MKLRNQIGQNINKHKASQTAYRMFVLLWRKIFFWKWVLEGYIGRNVCLNTSRKATVIIPSYHVKRVRDIEPLIRTILRCDFVEKIIVSNNNPEIRIEDWIKLNDVRVVLIDQATRRGCGYSYILADREAADYFFIIDDDLLIHPVQLAVLFQHLVEDDEVPHGLAGCDFEGNYIDREETEVEVLFKIYAVTKAHVQAYLGMVAEITANNLASYRSIEFWSDDIIISHVNRRKPRIHDTGSILNCQTCDAHGVAIYLEEEFQQERMKVADAIRKMNLNGNLTS